MLSAAPSFALAVVLFAAPVISAQAPAWQTLPPIPDPEGFAAPFAGVSGGALVVAGGANIPGDKWAEPFTKRWYGEIYVLESPAAQWQAAGKLPRPLAYGVSITADDSLVCLGGSDASQHYADAFRLRYRDGIFRLEPLPNLPQPCAHSCGALVGRTIYLAGGLASPTATAALKTFWALDLDASTPRWRELQPWPGPERMLGVAGVQDGYFYLFSGARLLPGTDGLPVREYLRDAWRFHPSTGWQRLADLPRAAVAAPSPALAVDASRLLIASGDDGLNIHFQPVKEHPGFPRDFLAYDTASDRWQMAGALPFSRATAPTVIWHGLYLVPNGEVRPRVRTPEVWALPLP